MNREIKFRVYDNSIKEWRYFSLPWGDGLYLGGWMDKNTCGQFTGLYDKNGKEIYEGDIIKYHSKIDNTKTYHTRIVYWNNKRAMFFIKKVDVGGCNPIVKAKSKRSYEVIGNIHENLELLKVKHK